MQFPALVTPKHAFFAAAPQPLETWRSVWCLFPALEHAEIVNGPKATISKALGGLIVLGQEGLFTS